VTPTPRITDAAGMTAAAPRSFEIGPAGLGLNVQLADTRKLKSARLSFAAASATAAEIAPPVALDSDGFTVNAQGLADTGNAANSHWLSVNWDLERAITSLTIAAPMASPATPTCGARVRMFSAGNWLPLPPRDTLSFVAGKASARFPACAASRLMIELLAENQVSGNWTGVQVPGAVNLSGVKVNVTATPQPCHFSVAIADDPPFFHVGGPMPVQAVAVDGLVRALNRYLFDHPGATTIPLLLRAAAPARLQWLSFDAEQEPVPPVVDPSRPAPAPPRVEQAGVQPAADPAAARGRWCDAGHRAAQAFDPPPAGSGLSAVELFVRPLGAAAAVSGTLSIHGEVAGRPAELASAGPVNWQIQATAERPGHEDWLRCELPLPAPVPTSRWWVVLQVDQGELLWYLGDVAPAGAGPGLCRTADGAWMPASAQPQSWLQARLALIAVAAAVTA
jgi:hypothetical protein